MDPEKAHEHSTWKASRYNWILPLEGHGAGGAVYNAFTGACVDFSADDFEQVRGVLCAPRDTGIDFAALGANAVSLGGALIAGGFLVESGFDELRDLETRTASQPDNLPLVLVISPTFACNLGCGYCFVGKKQGVMRRETEHDLVRFVTGQLDSGDVPSFTVDWFGGEPLLARKSMERLSLAFLELCGSRGVPYRAQVITNGTLLDADLVECLPAWGVDLLQITLDGVRSTHDVRRRWKGKSVTARSSYDDTLRGVECAIGRFAIRLRINVDRENLEEAFSLLQDFDARGWVTSDSRFYPYPAMVSDFTVATADGWSAADECALDAYYDLHQRWLDFLSARGVPVVGERLYGFPEPITASCGAFSKRGWVVNYDGSLHKCGVDADTDSRSVGTVNGLLDITNENVRYWSEYEPVADPTCRECRALPVCLGGCARDRREDRHEAMARNCMVHLKHEPEIISQHVRIRREKTQRADGI